MAATTEPPEESVSYLCEMLNLTRRDAIMRLKANDNDPNRAATEYFDGPSNKYEWDESQFASDRQGEMGQSRISFNIQGPDELPTSYQNSAAPTRPPSRVDTRSPIGVPMDTDQEDAELRAALAESAAQSGLAPQESGIMDDAAVERYFGPANRPEYAPDQWAMVPRGTLQSKSTEPPPSSRRRDVNSPAFLQQTGDHRLGAIITIFHKIPATRNMLLTCGPAFVNYGSNTAWWKGQPILKQEDLEAMARGESVPDNAQRTKFTHELQRLMAFLDNTQRSYGTVDSLIKTEPMGEADPEAYFFYALQGEAEKPPGFDTSAVTTWGRNISVEGLEEIPEIVEVKSSLWVPLSLTPDQYPWVNSLYSAMDHFMWPDGTNLDVHFPQGAHMNVFTKLGPVMTIRIEEPGLEKPCEIPPVFYADRYVESRRHLAVEFQQELRKIKDYHQRLSAWESSHAECTGQFGCSKLVGIDYRHDIRQCTEKIIELAEKALEQQKQDAQWRYYENRWIKGLSYSMDDLRLIHTRAGPCELTPEESSRKVKLERIIQGCQNKRDSQIRDLTKSRARRDELLDSLQIVNKCLTSQENETGDEVYIHHVAHNPEYWNPTQKYLLRGIALTKELSFMCVREETEPLGLDNTPGFHDQWWRFGYEDNSESPVKLEKVTLEDALVFAGTGDRCPVLIYATEAALEENPAPLSDPLRMFVKADNRSFQQELDREQDESSVVELTDYNGAFSAPPYAHQRKPSIISIGSSAATVGSSSNSLNDMDLDMPHVVDFQDDGKPIASHEEFAVSSHEEFAKPGPPIRNVCESLASCRVYANESPVLGNRNQSDSLDHQVQEPCTAKAAEANMSSTGSKGPEMQERAGGTRPFLAPPTARGPVDLMDMELEVDQTGD
ncbi:hypothetical protein F4778DRAFT_731087 [Xylariomycetidae sp. FL2044]|nr:hypothetical protein F4778DRAFT_731087 [Xylariomycetidae sp. FL2044]